MAHPLYFLDVFHTEPLRSKYAPSVGRTVAADNFESLIPVWGLASDSFGGGNVPTFPHRFTVDAQ